MTSHCLHRRATVSTAVAEAVLVLGLCASLPAQTASPAAATRWTIDPATSLVWWQIDPHFGHLWATTCPEDPSWQAGEGRSPGYYVNLKSRPEIKTTKYKEKLIPLFPRYSVRPLCRRAVSGTVQMADRETYRGVTGEVSVIADSITMGLDLRDDFSRKFVYKPYQYPTIKFRLDSVTSVQLGGDTVKARAHGVFHFRDKTAAYTMPVLTWREKAGMRVTGFFTMTARDLTDTFGVSKVAMGAGVGLQLWDSLHMGFDLILKPEGPVPAVSSNPPSSP